MQNSLQLKNHLQSIVCIHTRLLEILRVHIGTLDLGDFVLHFFQRESQFVNAFSITLHPVREISTQSLQF